MLKTTELLRAARTALQQGDYTRAEILYQQCLAQDLSVSSEYAGLLYTQGRFSSAEKILDEAIARTPADSELLFLRGLTRKAANRLHRALTDFDAALEHAPRFTPALLHRALALIALERTTDAVGDMRRLCDLSPRSADAWANLGILCMSCGDYEEATTALQTANRLSPDHPQIMRSLANALGAVGQLDEALVLHSRVRASMPRDADACTDQALCLFKANRIKQSSDAYRSALELDPRNQTALAGLYLTANELDQLERAAELMNYPALLGFGRWRVDDSIDLADLQAAVIAHPGLVWEPAGRSTVGGQQTAKLDLAANPAFEALGRMVERFVREQIARLSTDASLLCHPWLKAIPAHWRLQAWATILHDGGRQTPHIHPAGWMSGVFYLDPGQPTAPESGNLIFGHPQPDIGPSRPPLEHVHRPSKAELIAFPSYFFHHTTPYRGETPRISIAFDVVPA